MREISSDEARTGFRALLDEAIRGNVVRVMRHGQPVAVLVPDEQYQAAESARAFPLDMAQVKCPRCEADAYPDSLGEALDWAASHKCEGEA